MSRTEFDLLLRNEALFGVRVVEDGPVGLSKLRRIDNLYDIKFGCRMKKGMIIFGNAIADFVTKRNEVDHDNLVRRSQFSTVAERLIASFGDVVISEFINLKLRK